MFLRIQPDDFPYLPDIHFFMTFERESNCVGHKSLLLVTLHVHYSSGLIIAL